MMTMSKVTGLSVCCAEQICKHLDTSCKVLVRRLTLQWVLIQRHGCSQNVWGLAVYRLTQDAALDLTEMQLYIPKLELSTCTVH